MNGYERTNLDDPAWEGERTRLSSMAALFDGVTRHRLDALGVRPGWRCWEIGAGTGSIARHLADVTGPSGHVVASDLDVRFLDELGELSTVQIVRHDVSDDPVQAEAFDLVHARAVLAYVPRRDEAVPRLVQALRPGGVLLLEDVVFGEGTTDALAAVTRPREHAWTLTLAARAVAGALRTVGADPEYGLRLPDALAGAGLRDIGADLAHRLVRGGSSEAAFFAVTMRELGPRLVGAGLLTQDDAELAATLAEDPSCQWFSMGLVGAWGWRP
jgi:SAM-dependent methyltransferase